MNKTVKTMVPLNQINSEILRSVIGQMSDGIWENSRRMESIWRGLSIGSDNNYLTIEVGSSSELYYRNDEQVEIYFADKIKQIVKTFITDNPMSKAAWDRSCRVSVDYLNYFADVQVRDAYQVYDILKGRTLKTVVPAPKRLADVTAGMRVEGLGEITSVQTVSVGVTDYVVVQGSYGEPVIMRASKEVRVS